MLPLEFRPSKARVLRPLIKRSQIRRTESLSMIQRPSFNRVVVDVHTAVRVPDREIDSEIVPESVVVEVEFGERSVSSAENEHVRAEHQPEDEDEDGSDDEDRADDLEDAGADAIHDAAAEAAERVAAASAAAAAMAVVGFGRWWNGWAVVGAVELRLSRFSSH